MKQIGLFSAPQDQSVSKFVSIYRVSLVKDKSISFGHRRMNNSKEAQSLIQSLIKTQQNHWPEHRFHRWPVVCIGPSPRSTQTRHPGQFGSDDTLS